VALSSYLVNGGDGYEMFRGSRYLVPLEQGQSEAIVLMNHIENLHTIDFQTDGRITAITLAP